ncbi:hypothetical protein LBMAG42_32830 [Deltaproteobacteria bacterium]|nr:hypothetical protein LBMAG42_32830 [Deltaproteobacteria bacterium]
MARALLCRTADTSWWDAVDMRDGSRRVMRRGLVVVDGLSWGADPADSGVAWSGRLNFTLGELMPHSGEAPLGEDASLVAGIAVAGLRALAEGRLCGGASLCERMVSVEGSLQVVGSDVERGGAHDDRAPDNTRTGRVALAGLLTELDPGDTFGLAALLSSEAHVDAPRFLIAAFAAFLAHERHVLVRRAAADRRGDALAALRALARRLARAAPPPACEGADVRCDGTTVVAADGAVIWDGAMLDARRARAAARALAGVVPEPAIRRWIVAMSRLRVDREILGRRLR